METKKLVVSTQENHLGKAIRTDLPRIIAIIMVIISHVYAYFTPQSLSFLNYFGKNGTNLQILLTFPLIFLTFMSYFGQIGVCTFFVCSGANLSPSTFSLKKKFIRIYPAFILTYLVGFLLFPAPPWITLVSYAGLLNGFYGLSYSYLWFIPALFGLYVLYPIIQKAVEHKVGIVLLFAISSCGMIYLILSYLSSGSTTPYYSATLNAIFPFVLGMLTKKVKRRYGLLILLFVVIYFLGASNANQNITFFMLVVFPGLIAYGIFCASSNTIKTRWSDTSYVLYLLHPVVFLSLFKFLGLIGVFLGVPVLLFSGWYGTRLNNKLTVYLTKKVIREGEEKKEIIKKAKKHS